MEVKLEVSASDYDADIAEWGEDTFGMDDNHAYDDAGYFDPDYAANPVREVLNSPVPSFITIGVAICLLQLLNGKKRTFFHLNLHINLQF